MPFDRKTYFDSVRASLFAGNLNQQQVDGQEAILGAWEKHIEPRGWDVRWLAYCLATTIHETASTMWPIAEYGEGAGREYGVADPQTGQTYYGRGFVQLTWRENYARATKEIGLEGEDDLEWHAECALDLRIAARVMFQGMSVGWFTGRKLGDYFSESKDDPKNARQIVNGNDCDTMIAGYHELFLAALEDAWRATPAPEPEPVPEPGPPDPLQPPAPEETTELVITIRITAPAGSAINVETTPA